MDMSAYDMSASEIATTGGPNSFVNQNVTHVSWSGDEGLTILGAPYTITGLPAGIADPQTGLLGPPT